MASFDSLATELISQIFLSCSSVSSVLALASTCHRFHQIYNSSQKLNILYQAAESEFGPLADLTQLLTHNASQPAHISRNVPFSTALLSQVVKTGRIAEKWTTLYPFKKWKYNYEARRVLTEPERYRLRRALYRLWLYDKAFHTSEYPRETRVRKPVMQTRARLLHNWSTEELAQMADLHSVIREVVQSNVCPSNGAILRRFRKRTKGMEESIRPQLFFNIHLNYPLPSTPAPFLGSHQLNSEFHNNNGNNGLSFPKPLSDHFHTTPTYTSRFASSKWYQEPGAEGWGDDIPHYYVVEDMLKLDPGQIMWLKENAMGKAQVEGYVRALGDWFENNGETWGQTLEWVLEERGEDVVEFLKGVVWEGGIVGEVEE